jgi:signal transduction histidine kinase
MMSHEIRTPLQGILGLLELVEYSPLSAEQRRQVRLASEAGQALRQILTMCSTTPRWTRDGCVLR